MPQLRADIVRLLDLFCCAGGSAVGYHRAGFDEIVGVDHKFQKNYPAAFCFVQMDALEAMAILLSGGYIECARHGEHYRLSDFDAIHASPPCQAYVQRNKNLETNHPKLIEPVRKRLREWGGIYVIENVLPDVLVDSIKVCGTALGLRVIRHRFFEVPDIAAFDLPCQHEGTVSEGDYAAVYARGGKGPRRGAGKRDAGPTTEGPDWPEAMGIDWMTRYELTQAIPPAYCEYIGRHLIALPRDGGGTLSGSSLERVSATTRDVCLAATHGLGRRMGQRSQHTRASTERSS